MTIDEVVLLLKASQGNGLTTLQEMVLRASWEGKTYTSIALAAHYGEERVRKVASHLWQLLSDVWREPINKFNFRQTLESRRLSKAQQQLIQEFNRAATAISLEFPSGPVSLNSKFYIPRSPIEENVYAEIAEPGSVICIRASKKMGKSSLVLRLLTHGAQKGWRTVNLDFQQADKAIFSNLDKFLRWLCANISRELQLEPKLNDYWNEEMGSKVSCCVYFQKYLLCAADTPLVLVLNEVDWVFEYPEIAEEFLPLVRSWYEQAKSLEIWQKLRLVLVYSTEIIVPLKLSQFPFNVGLTIQLPDFSKQQVQDLAQRHGLDWTDGKDAENLMAMVGGHPYLVRLALYHLVGKSGLETNLRQLLQQAPTATGIYHEYLSQYILTLRQEPELSEAFFEVVNSSTPVKLPPVLAYKLKNMGLVNLEGDRCTPMCELYRLYFRQQFNMSDDLNHVRMAQLEKENQQLRVLSSLDELTQLPNYRYFQAYLQAQWQKAIQQREGSPLSLILCDIDYFKIYNKIYGTSSGDQCLQRIAQTIQNFVKCQLQTAKLTYASSNKNNSSHNIWETAPMIHLCDDSSVLVARYGGEEFAILCQADSDTSMDIAEKIRTQIKDLAITCDYPGIGGLPATVLTVSLGVASCIPDAAVEPNMLTDAAQQALGQAKRQGRDRAVLAQMISYPT
ncbi:AAA-like domain-containing protein [Fortiea contorta]|uniref:AAA-like domain-containing protein n=1 Tax=Fortiea contorta TaxID=1892405 RepID=UPI00034DD3F3|nr:AAA-like domain-containing protein [Fortiea contorta]